MSKKSPRGKEYIMLLLDKMSEEGFAVAENFRILIEQHTFILDEKRIHFTAGFESPCFTIKRKGSYRLLYIE